MKRQLSLLFMIPIFFTLQIAFAVEPPAKLPQTGQSKCFDSTGSEIVCAGSGQDGDIRAGVEWPLPRFTNNSNGTVTDNFTGLIWLMDATCFGTKGWQEALNSANSLASGSCGLTDGSKAGDWRLPNKLELFSLVDLSQINPVLPAANPFNNVLAGSYWSSSTYAGYTGSAWGVAMDTGGMYYGNKGNYYYVWPVRAGQ